MLIPATPSSPLIPDLSDRALSELYEDACAQANRLYTDGMDTTRMDDLCDEVQAELERRGF
jgi:hypothetical protein